MVETPPTAPTVVPMAELQLGRQGSRDRDATAAPVWVRGFHHHDAHGHGLGGAAEKTRELGWTDGRMGPFFSEDLVTQRTCSVRRLPGDRRLGKGWHRMAYGIENGFVVSRMIKIMEVGLRYLQMLTTRMTTGTL